MPEPEHGRRSVPDGPADDVLPDRRTTPLLTLISRQSLDEDYLAAARRRATAATPRAGSPPTRRGSVAAMVVVVLFGLLVATAAVQTNRTAGAQNASRTGLIDRIEQQRSVVAGQQRSVARLRMGTVTWEKRLALSSQEQQSVASRLLRLQVSTGFAAVTGPGVRVVLDSAPGADEEQAVRDSDLALLVNALWSAGAEAVAVNGQRMTTLNAIGVSGAAVEVDGVGIEPPYTVTAIGDQRTLQARFYDSSSGLAFDDLARRYGFILDLQNADGLSLPAAPAAAQRLRSSSTGTGATIAPRVTEPGSS